MSDERWAPVPGDARARTRDYGALRGSSFVAARGCWWVLEQGQRCLDSNAGVATRELAEAACDDAARKAGAT